MNWKTTGRAVARALCLALAAVTLAGCVVVPLRPYHPYRAYYYYP